MKGFFSVALSVFVAIFFLVAPAFADDVIKIVDGPSCEEFYEGLLLESPVFFTTEDGEDVFVPIKSLLADNIYEKDFIMNSPDPDAFFGWDTDLDGVATGSYNCNAATGYLD